MTLVLVFIPIEMMSSIKPLSLGDSKDLAFSEIKVPLPLFRMISPSCSRDDRARRTVIRLTSYSFPMDSSLGKGASGGNSPERILFLMIVSSW